MKSLFFLTALMSLPVLRAQDRQLNPTVGLRQVVKSLDLRDVQLREALRLLTEESGVNLVASEEAGNRSITCYLLDVTLRDAIETLSKTYGLWFKIEETSNIVRIMTAKEFERDLLTFRDEQTKVFTLFFPNAVDVAVAIRNLFGSRVRLSLDNELMSDEYTEIVQRFQRFDIVDRRGQSLGVTGGDQGNVGSQSQQSANLYNRGSNALQSQTQQYRPDQREEALRQNQRALSAEQLDRLERALASEGGQLDPSLVAQLKGEQTSIFLTIQRRNNMIGVRTADAAAMRQIEGLVRQLDVPTPQVLLEVKILLVDLGDDFRSTFDGEYVDQHHDVTVAPSPASATDPSALLYQVVSDHFALRLQMLQSKNRVSTLATPMLLVANNEVSRLFVGEERPIVRNISSQVSQSQSNTVVTPNSTIELRPVGTTLLITPNINADRTVTLRVLNELSSVRANAGSIPVVTSDGNVVNQAVDTVASRSVSGTLVAHDGMTLALGGLVQEDVGVAEEGVPLLMDLPVLGFLFRREVKTRSHSELIVMIRPYVLFTPTEGKDISKTLVDKLSLHPSAESQGESMNVFDGDEVPRGKLGKHPLLDMLKYQSGMPGGR